MRAPLSIIIVNRYAPESLEHCLRSIQVATKMSAEVIVVDVTNDETIKDTLRQSGLHGHYFSYDKKHGYSGAANFGAQHSTGELICFLEGNTVLQAHSLDRLADWVQQHPRSVVGPRVLDHDGGIRTSIMPYVTRRQTWGDEIFGSLPWPRSWEPWLAWLMPQHRLGFINRYSRDPRPVPVLGRYCIMTSRKTWEIVGEWHQELYHFGIESEWCLRARDSGVAVYFIPTAEIYFDDLAKPMPDIFRREKIKQDRHWHAKQLGLIAGGILLFFLWWESKLKPPRERD